MSEPGEANEPNEPKRSPMRFRRSSTPKLEAGSARRQGEITSLAFRLLGKDKAIEFLNSNNAELGGRPLDLAIASAGGSASVEAALGRLAQRDAEES